ncbi:uncharacterized protein LOC116766978 [Danaus plexippus]|uniref:uncharacterized protein LOC116766978 n=1 Tax=Danaus plexippus TaxID=13037 RepID=UPI002AB1DFF7|nr:uncharacterized protein LOC116766978 [Danaus plexippus]
MAPIRYSLHYEDYSEHLMSRFGKLLQMQSLVDMTLMCSSHTLRVHKAVLAASSAYFQEVLQKQTGEPLIILKMRFSVLKCLVEFMYCGKTQCLEENLDELVSAAQFLKIKGLSKVTKEGLGITNHTELPVFTPPVVINRPPQSLIDLHTQDNVDPKPQTTLSTPANQPVDALTRTNKDMVVRIPFDIEGSGAEYNDPRARPRRGRPSFKRPLSWENAVGGGVMGTASGLGRAAERALLRREQDSRKAIHHLKHLQSRHMQDYMDRVTLSQAVNSICNDGSSSYLNMDNDLLYMDQTVSSNSLDPTNPYSKDHSLGSETITSNYSTAITSTANTTTNSGINTAMSQYVNALKNAGLPTDLPILFESGDGSYINVNEQVLLDMVQSSEIQYEVIEQPNIIEKVADPSEIKSIDDLSKSIERGEMLMGSKNYTTSSDFDKESSVHEDTIHSLNAILPDNLESFGDQQNYVVLDKSLQDSRNTIDHDSANDFSCIENDMQFFTKSMSDDVKKYYEEQQLNDATTSLDTSFNMSLLDTKSSHLTDNMNQSYNSLNTDDMKRNVDCYDFSLQLPHATDFKEDALDCLMSTPRRTENQDGYIDDTLDNTRVQERDEIIKDLMNIENKIVNEQIDDKSNEQGKDTADDDFGASNTIKDSSNFSDVSTNDLHWNLNTDANNHKSSDFISTDFMAPSTQASESIEDLAESLETEKWEMTNEDQTDKNNVDNNDDTEKLDTAVSDDIPFAVGLLPLKQIQAAEDESSLKRKSLYDLDMTGNDDAKCLKRKLKYKKK